MIITLWIILTLITSSLTLTIYLILKYYNIAFLTRLSRDNEMKLYTEEIDYQSQNITFYYADFTKCILDKPHCITASGVYKIGSTIEEQAKFNIAGICEFAIINLEAYYRTQNTQALFLFEANLKWLVDNGEEKNGSVLWYYNYDMGAHTGKWASCISQGMAVSVLTRAYSLYNDEKYLELAKKGIKPVIEPRHQGGFKYQYDHFNNWFEESMENTHILNGHVYAMLGIYDLYRITHQEQYLLEFKAATLDIKKNISYFDLGFASTYDAQEKIIANNSYHVINTNLMKVLFDITNDVFFIELYHRWMQIFEKPKVRWFAAAHSIFYIINLKISDYWKKK